MKKEPDSATYSWANRMVIMMLFLGFMVTGVHSSIAQDLGSANENAQLEGVFFVPENDNKPEKKPDGGTPIITAVSPNSGPQSGGELVMIVGDNFKSKAKVFFDETPVKLIVVNTEIIVVSTPAHEVGWSAITVLNPNEKTDTLDQGYNFLPLPDADIDAPTVSIQSLSGDTDAPYLDGDNDGVTDLVLMVSDERSGVAGCRFSTQSQVYDMMNGICNLPTNGAVSCPLGALNRAEYSYYYSCKDIAGKDTEPQNIVFTLDWLDAITGIQASDGEFTDKVVVTWNPDRVALGYKVWDGSSWVDVGNATRFEDFHAPAPIINTGSVDASDGINVQEVQLISSGISTQPGDKRLYTVKGYTATGDGMEGLGDVGHRSVGELQTQWQISSGDSDQDFSDIPGALTQSFIYTGVPADGVGRFYRLRLNAMGAQEVFSSSERGFRKPYDRTNIEEPTQEVLLEEISKGNITTESSAPDEAEEATFYADYTFTSQSTTVAVPPETIMARTGGGLLNILDFQVEDITRDVAADRTTKTFAGVRLGYVEHGLTFSQPITITFNIGYEQEGKLVDIVYRSAGEKDWHHETYCTVENGICSFQVTHATDYAAGPGPLVVRESALVNLGLDAIISLACTDSVIMGNITGYGKSDLSSNTATCNVRTNNSGGYKLEWQASENDMNTGAPNNDTFAAYTPDSPDTPEIWSVTTAESGWGARLSDTSTTNNTSIWGADDQSGIDYGSTAQWLNVRSASPFQIVQRTTETDTAGDDEVILFGAEIGSSKIQPTGTYQVNVTMTATTL